MLLKICDYFFAVNVTADEQDGASQTKVLHRLPQPPSALTRHSSSELTSIQLQTAISVKPLRPSSLIDCNDFNFLSVPLNL